MKWFRDRHSALLAFGLPLGAALASLGLAGRSSAESPRGGEREDAGSHTVATPSVDPPAVAPPAPLVRPELPDVSDRDLNRDGIDDALQASSSADVVTVNVILTKPTLQSHLDGFVQQGGHVEHVFARLSYGWIGSISRSKLNAVRADLGSDLWLITAPRAVGPYLDEATRTGRVRVVWASGFASGFSGNANITIGIIDRCRWLAHRPERQHGRLEGLHHRQVGDCARSAGPWHPRDLDRGR